MHNIGEGSLNIPPEWHNQSINIFTAQPPGAPGISVTVNRDRLAYGNTLQDYAAQQCQKLEKQLSKLDFKERGFIELDGHPAFHCEFTWVSVDVGQMHQMLVCIAKGPLILNLASSFVGPMSEPQRQHLKAVLHSFRFNAPAAEATDTPPPPAGQ